MVGGQVLDLEGERQAPDLERVRGIHRRKTAALIRASLEIGAILGGAGPPARRALAAYGEALGLAFQIVDDCLDLTSTPEELGKSPGKDQAAAKLTWPSCVGIEASRDEAVALAEGARRELTALSGLPGLESAGRFLEDLASYVVRRRA
jgi:farnesyl diphosphate synthase